MSEDASKGPFREANLIAVDGLGDLSDLPAVMRVDMMTYLKAARAEQAARLKEATPASWWIAEAERRHGKNTQKYNQFKVSSPLIRTWLCLTLHVWWWGRILFHWRDWLLEKPIVYILIGFVPLIIFYLWFWWNYSPIKHLRASQRWIIDEAKLQELSERMDARTIVSRAYIDAIETLETEWALRKHLEEKDGDLSPARRERGDQALYELKQHAQTTGEYALALEEFADLLSPCASSSEELRRTIINRYREFLAFMNQLDSRVRVERAAEASSSNILGVSDLDANERPGRAVR